MCHISHVYHVFLRGKLTKKQRQKRAMAKYGAVRKTKDKPLWHVKATTKQFYNPEHAKRQTCVVILD